MFVDPVFKASDESLYGPAGKAAAKEQYSWMGKVAGWCAPSFLTVGFDVIALTET